MSDVTDRVEGLVHEPTQTTERGVELTLAGVARVQEPGQVDFGDNELADPTLIEEVAERRDADDDYGWWHLDAGTYLVTYNESLDGDDPLRLAPRRAITTRGATHPTISVTTLDPIPLTTAGIKLKENARISTLRPVPDA